MSTPAVKKLDLEGGPSLAVRLAGTPEKPAVLLLHGSPSSSRTFRHVIGPLAQDCFVIAPDLPGYGDSEPIEQTSFSRFADVIDALLARLGVGSFYLYLHDFGAAVGLYLATRAPHRIRGLIIQNGNAHESGLGPAWAATKAFWADPTPVREAEAITHLNFEGTRKVYVEGVPPDIVARMDPGQWEEDWRIMSRPGRCEKERALVLDYRSHVARFGEIADYLKRWQPPALLLWGRHDIFFDLDETLSWIKALPRMEAHVFDAGHSLLETHSPEAASLMDAFITRTLGVEPQAEPKRSCSREAEVATPSGGACRIARRKYLCPLSVKSVHPMLHLLPSNFQLGQIRYPIRGSTPASIPATVAHLKLTPETIPPHENDSPPLLIPRPRRRGLGARRRSHRHLEMDRKRAQR